MLLIYVASMRQNNRPVGTTHKELPLIRHCASNLCKDLGLFLEVKECLFIVTRNYLSLSNAL